MILREWRGVTTTADRDAYIEYLHETGLGDYAATPGNAGVLLLSREIGEGRTEFVTLTLWQDMDAIRAFAGEDAERARYYRRDSDFLETLSPTVNHYRIEHRDRLEV
jgi:heme-degrading monooxygenase HmoA